MHVTDDFRDNPDAWHGIALPTFDPNEVAAQTNNHPYWLHFGAGNLFRAVHAAIAQHLLDEHETKAGVLVAETFDPDIIDQAYAPYVNRCLQVVLNGDGSTNAKLIASVAGAFAIRSHDEHWNSLQETFVNPQLQFVTVTITEKGYAIEDEHNNPLPWIIPEIEGGPNMVVSAMGAITALLLARFNAGGVPIAMISTDNFSENGDRFRLSIHRFAKLWQKHGFVNQQFVDWLSDSSKVSFPLTMIDRITPNPATSVAKLLADRGFADASIIHTAKGTNVATFSNTEATWYLVIEDVFPNGRPDLTKAGVYLADRDTVNRADERKVTTCLNPLHTALATFGMLLGYPSMSDTIADPDLKSLAERLGYAEGLPVVANPGIFSPREFLRQVIEERIPNPNIPDTPARICADTSQKIPVRYGVTIGKYLASNELDVDTLVAIPLAIAGWLRLLLGRDGRGIRDDGSEVTLSPDPRLADLQSALAPLSIGGDLTNARSALKPILADASIFGTDLNQTALADKIVDHFVQLAASTNTAHAVIERALGL